MICKYSVQKFLVTVQKFLMFVRFLDNNIIDRYARFASWSYGPIHEVRLWGDFLQKSEYEKKLKRTIRYDTYYMIEYMRQGYSYGEAKDIVLEKYGSEFSPNVLQAFVKKATIVKILNELNIVDIPVKVEAEKADEICYIVNNQKIVFEGEKINSLGIYGIYVDNKLVYIGMTTRSFKERWDQHVQLIKANDSQYLYRYLKSYNKIEFKVLLDVHDMKTRMQMRKRDIQSIELALITIYQPSCNIEGRIKLYNYSQKE